MPTFASARARSCFMEQCSYFPKSQDYYHGMLQQLKDLLLLELEFRRVSEHKIQFLGKVFHDYLIITICLER